MIRAQPTAEEAEILARRAAWLARPAPVPGAARGDVQALEFAIGAQRCLLELRWLREVLPLRELLVVPGAPASLLGLVALRGQMLPVLDLSTVLGIPPARSRRANRLLVVGRHAPAFGVAASEVHGLREVAAAEAERRTEGLEGLRPELVRGVAPEGQLVLDGARLLSLPMGAAAASPATLIKNQHE